MRNALTDVILKRFEHPDEERTFELGRFELVTLGGMTLGRATYLPGWRWSTHVGAVIGETHCTVEHVGLVLSGHATAAMPDGTIHDLTAGTLFYIPAEPHDSWVVGTEPYVSLHFLGAAGYAKQHAARREEPNVFVNGETNTFIDPHGQNQESIRRLITTAVNLVLESHGTAATRAPCPEPAEPDDFAIVPEEPLSETALFARMSVVLAQSRNLSHPGYIGNMESMPTTMSIIGGLLMSAARNNMLAEEMSPFLSRIEPAVVQWFARRFGLGQSSGGQLLAGGSLANLQALVVARNVHCGSKRTGLSAQERRPVLFASEAAHSSLQKAAMVMGLGTVGVVPVRADADSRMDVNDLETKIRLALDSNQHPFCVVGTAGTTITGNIDPLEEVAAICRRYSVWFHADAIYGGALILSDRHRGALRGIEHADSIAFNLHKWGYLANTCSMLMFRDCEQRDEHFRIAAPYMNRARESANLGECSLQGSRQADIIPLILSLQHLGRSGYARLIDSRMELARYLRTRLESSGLVELSGDTDTNIVCFRGRADVECVDSSMAAWQTRLLREHDVFLTLPFYRGRWWLKADILNPFTNKLTIDKLSAGLQRVAGDT